MASSLRTTVATSGTGSSIAPALSEQLQNNAAASICDTIAGVISVFVLLIINILVNMLVKF
jgi:hypothetical protein